MRKLGMLVLRIWLFTRNIFRRSSPEPEAQNYIDVMEEIRRFGTLNENSRNFLKELIQADVPPDPWEPLPVGPTFLVSYEHFSDLVSHSQTVSFLPSHGPEPGEPPELHTLTAEEFLGHLRAQIRGESVGDLELTPLERNMAGGEIEKFLLVRQAKHGIQSWEILGEAFGRKAGWRLTVDRGSVLETLVQDAEDSRHGS